MEETTLYCVECGTPIVVPVHKHFCCYSCFILYKGEME